jgi:hypothetical protein
MEVKTYLQNLESNPKVETAAIEATLIAPDGSNYHQMSGGLEVIP